MTRHRFEFGRNWALYSRRVLDAARLAEAARSLEGLLGEGALEGVRFLDVGCGTGLFAIAAARLGAAEVVGIDVDPGCVEVARRNAARFLGRRERLRFLEQSVLDAAGMAGLGVFDVVYAWGSLHHTGRLWEALRRAAERVKPRGRLVVAIYNRHLTSPGWRAVKRLYQALPGAGRAAAAAWFAVVLFAAKLVVTGRNPLRKRRGMSFLVDVIDWVGGYPYEYASRTEVEAHAGALGLRLERFVPAPVPTGCHEYVFQRTGDGACDVDDGDLPGDLRGDRGGAVSTAGD